ncbi:MAG: arginine deiminase-related protein [Gammaproteobacteria bacterium]|nr:arginine deiminase-related protein [Gammaproteobacteria bacterium]
MNLLASTVMVTPPEGFRANRETFASNAFQQQIHVPDLQATVLREHAALVAALKRAGIRVIRLAVPPERDLPDAVFLNNWFSTHPDGRLVFYPMAAPSRRRERNTELASFLEGHGFAISETIDLSHHESENRFLEGTGSLVLDHRTGTAFACASVRTERALAEAWAERMGFELQYFSALDKSGLPIYHTNVIMTVGPDCSIVAADLVPDEKERSALLAVLKAEGRDVVSLSSEQVAEFAGNQLFLQGSDGAKLFLSETADKALTKKQKKTLDRHAERIPVDTYALERLGGGSVRCMLAEVFLPKKEK